MADINNNVINNYNDQNQQEYSADNTLTPKKIPLYFQKLLHQNSLIQPAKPTKSESRFQAIKNLTDSANVGRDVLTEDVIFA